jgi:hypothetical protein
MVGSATVGRPWDKNMDDIDIQIHSHTLRLAQIALETIWPLQERDRVAEASVTLYKRIIDALSSICVLRTAATHSWEHDGVTILRSMYDALLQLLYLLFDAASRRELAELYLDYAFVERHRGIVLVDKNDSDFAKSLSRSAKRATGEPELHAELRLRGQRFLTADGNRELSKRGNSYLTDRDAKYRRTWYAGTLETVAEQIGYLSEYKLIQHIGSSCVHVSSLPIQRGTLIRPEKAPFWGMFFALRATGAIANAFNIELSQEDRQIVDLGQTNIFARDA